MFNLELYPQLQEFLYTDFFNTNTLPHIFYKMLFAMVLDLALPMHFIRPKRYFLESLLLLDLAILSAPFFCKALFLALLVLLFVRQFAWGLSLCCLQNIQKSP